MGSNTWSMRQGMRLATIHDEELCSLTMPGGQMGVMPGAAAEHVTAADTSGLLSNMPFHKTIVRQPFSLGSSTGRGSFHERRSSAPPAAAMRLACNIQRKEHTVNHEDSGSASDSTGAVIKEDMAAVGSRAYNVTGPATPRERRRSSWTGGAFPPIQPETNPGGQEGLPHDEIVRQFIAIRDAVLRKGQTGGGKQRAAIETCGAGADAAACSTSGQSRPERVLEFADATTSPEVATASGHVSPPDSPYKNAVAIATYAACASVWADDRLAPQAGVAEEEQFSVAQQSATDKCGATQRQPYQSPQKIDLQNYFHSPAASSSGFGARLSPLDGAVINAPDCVSYNALYGSGLSRPITATPFRSPSAQGRLTCTAFGQMEGIGFMPGADSLFSLVPSCEPERSNPIPLPREASCRQHTQPRLGDSASTGGPGTQLLVCRDDMASVGRSVADTARPSSSRWSALQPIHSASPPPVRGNIGDNQSRVEDSDAVTAGGKGTDVVVHQGRNGDGGFTPDYLKAVASAARRTLLPMSRVQSSGSLRGGGTPGLECGAVLSNGWTGAPTTSNNSIAYPVVSLQHPGDREDEPARVAYNEYVHLTLAGPPPSLPVRAESGQVALPPALAMHSSSSVVEATAGVVRRCLDKGFAFAAIPVKHFAAVMAAAEQHEGPLAYHIFSTHCVYYPGLGRHAASSGGGPSVLNGAGTPTCMSEGPKSGPASCTARTSPSTAAEEAATVMQQLLAGGEALHILSPGEYQRIRLAAQYSLRELRDILVAQAPLEAEATGSGQAALGMDARPGTTDTPGGRFLRHHRRGSSICSESNFSAVVVRSKSGALPLEGLAHQDCMSTPVGHGRSMSTAQGLPHAWGPSNRMKALIHAAQVGNMARVEYLVANGADVNAVESTQQQQAQGTPQAVRNALAGAFSGGAAAGGRTALHHAAMSGAFGVVQLLLHHGAFVGVRDGTGRTAYDLAMRKRHDAVAALLGDAAERRRDIVRNCAAESRATVAAAPRVAYPPPVPPRSKQQRSNSAPSSSAAAVSTSSATAGAPSPKDVDVNGTLPTTDLAGTGGACLETAGVDASVLADPGDSHGSSPVDQKLAFRAAWRCAYGEADSDGQLHDEYKKDSDEGLSDGPVKAATAVDKFMGAEPMAKPASKPVRRKGGLLACFFCGA